MEKQQFEFKPFDKVLVRDEDYNPWKADFYSHKCENTNYPHVTINGEFKQCIPYNAETAHLVNTCKPHERKIFIVSWPTSNGQHREEYTDEEFENFIKIAVLRNKDIQNFNVRKI